RAPLPRPRASLLLLRRRRPPWPGWWRSTWRGRATRTRPAGPPTDRRWPPSGIRSGAPTRRPASSTRAEYPPGPRTWAKPCSWAAAIAVCRHLDGLVFDLPSLDPEEAVLPLLAARAALGLRPAVGVLPAGATPEQVRLFAALALACDADVTLPTGASPAAQAALA